MNEITILPNAPGMPGVGRLQKLLDDLEATFSPEEIHPKMSQAEIMYQAGQQSVLAYIRRGLEHV
jgi:hypothetical protein